MSAPSRPPLPRTSPARRSITVGILLASTLFGLVAAGDIAPASAQSGSRLCASAFVSTVKGFEPNVTYVRLVEVAKNGRSGTVGHELCNKVRLDGTTYPGWSKSASYDRQECEDFSANVLAWNTLDVLRYPAYDYDGRDVCLSMQRSAIWIAKVVTDPATGARRLMSWSQDWPPPQPPAAQ